MPRTNTKTAKHQPYNATVQTPVHLSPGEAEAQQTERWARQVSRADARLVDRETPCRVCGGGVAVGQDVNEGRWRRHQKCALEPARFWRAIGHRVSPEDAALLARHGVAVPLFGSNPREMPDGQPQEPWAHITDDVRGELDAGLADLPRLRTEEALRGKPRRCETGCCAYCGVPESVSWTSHGHQWADGSPAPLCGPCSTVYERRGSPSPKYWDDQRAVLVECATGAPPQGDYDLPAFAERTEGPEGGTGAWEHVNRDALQQLRLLHWSSFRGKYAPDPVRKRQALLWRKRENVKINAAQRVRREREAARLPQF